MRRLCLAALLLAGCRGPDCCEAADCSEGTDQTRGSDVLRFRGKVPENLLILSIDTLRKDHVGFLSQSEGFTPFLDQLAAEGVVMRDHIQCANWTFGSMTCAVAGRTNPERGHQPRLSKPQRDVPDDTPFLATWMTNAGFATSLATANNWFSAKHNNTQGFQREKKLLDTPADEVILAGAKRIRRQSHHGRQPWFLHTHVMEPHLPYNPPDRYRQPDPDVEPWPVPLDTRKGQGYWRKVWPDLDQAERDQLEANTRMLYEADIRSVDDRIRKAWDQLEADCMLDDTLVVVFSDHGEGFWERGTHAHGHFLTAEENDGVLFFWAKNIEPGEWTGPTSGIDIVPTILDLFEIPLPDEVTGLPIGTAPEDRPVLAESVGYEGPLQAVVLDGYKMQYSWTRGETRVWHRAEDPEETVASLNRVDPVSTELWEALVPEMERMEAILGDTVTRRAAVFED